MYMDCTFSTLVRDYTQDTENHTGNGNSNSKNKGRLISFAVTTELVWAIVFAYAKSRFVFLYQFSKIVTLLAAFCQIKSMYATGI